MDSRSFVVIILFALFAVLHSGEALKCYECHSQQDDTCANKLESKHEATCSSGLTFCAACHVHIVGGKDIVVRSCIPDPGQLLSQYTKIDAMQCSACTTDLCNNANAMSINLGVLGCLVLASASGFFLTDY